MIDVTTVHTSSLDATRLQAIRRLLDDAFLVFDDDAWEHCLGGMHATIWEAGEVVAHASVVQRRLLHEGQALRTGYVEAVAVRADRRRRGYGRAVMERLGEVIRGAYEVGGLGAGEPAATLYRSLGWRAWEGRTWVLGPEGLARTPKGDGGVYVLPVTATLDLAGDLACDWRGGEVW
ncbi:MAG TPA: GNAT family N-acetyltransferase [Gaiella sp.]|nr:GNAT family N-acetyltransferase [Gaiella sp.]